MYQEIKCSWCGESTGLKKREVNYRTYGDSDVYVECPYCGSGDICTISWCKNYSAEQRKEIRERKYSCNKNYCQQKQQYWEKNYNEQRELRERLREREQNQQKIIISLFEIYIREATSENETVTNEDGEVLLISDAINKWVQSSREKNRLQAQWEEKKQLLRVQPVNNNTPNTENEWEREQERIRRGNRENEEQGEQERQQRNFNLVFEEIKNGKEVNLNSWGINEEQRKCCERAQLIMRNNSYSYSDNDIDNWRDLSPDYKQRLKNLRKQITDSSQNSGDSNNNNQEWIKPVILLTGGIFLIIITLIIRKRNKNR